MGKIKKARNKKYNPQKLVVSHMNHKAKKLILWRWESDKPEDPDVQFRHNLAGDVVVHAAFNMNRWYVQCVACCVDEKGDYYEEINEMVSEYCQVPELANDIEALCDDAAAQVNPKHLIDKLWVARILTKDMEHKLKDDEWLKQQSLHRSDMVLGAILNPETNEELAKLLAA